MEEFVFEIEKQFVPLAREIWNLQSFRILISVQALLGIVFGCIPLLAAIKKGQPWIGVIALIGATFISLILPILLIAYIPIAMLAIKDATVASSIGTDPLGFGR